MSSEVLQSINRDERERAIFQSRLKARMDMESNIASAEQRGMNKGIVKGRTEGERAKAFSIAQNLLSTSLSIKEIAKATGLTYKEIEDLRN